MHEAITWVRANAMQLTSVEAGHGFADLEPLRQIIGDARIVSLGEATHGTREFFQLKHRLLEFCVTELGFTVFGIEASYPECLRINDYVLTGAGHPAEALANQRFWTWDTEEVLALIEWMHTWNRTHARKVKFYGFDMQFPTEAALDVLDYLQRVAPELAAASKEPLWPLCDDVSADRFHLLSEPTRDAALAAVETIVDAFGREGLAWVAASSEMDWQLARMNAVVLHQSARLGLSQSGTTASISRDLAMAENVRALLELEGPDTKAVLWAHNGHARKIPYVYEKTVVPTMGSRLHELFGREQVVVGFAFNQGSFQAVQSGIGLVEHTVPPAPDGSLDQVLAAADMPACLLPLTSAPGTGPVADWLTSQPLSRSIGAVYSAEHAERFLQPFDPRQLYDVLAFVETTTAARPNEAGRRRHPPARDPAPAPANLELVGSGEVPDGWVWSAPRRVHAHNLVLSDGPSPAGGRSLRMARPPAPWRWGQGRLEQTFTAEGWRGKRMRFSAAVCAEGKVPGTGAYLYIEVRRKQPEGMAWTMPASDLAITEPPVRCAHWKTCAVEIVIPDDAHAILIGLAFAGTGTAWFGDVKLEACATS
jgi:erythromycin esterase